MTFDDDCIQALRQQCADHDAQIDTRLRQLFDPESRQKRRRRARVQRSAWITATAPQERPSASIMAGLQTYRGTIAVPRKTGRGQGITINPNNPASAAAPVVDPARVLRDMEIRAMAKRGMKHQQIADIVGVHKSTVGRVLRQSAA